MREISLVQDLLTLNEGFHLHSIQTISDKILADTAKTFSKMTKVLIKAMISDHLEKIQAIINILGRDGALLSGQKAQVRVLINQYLKGPYRTFLLSILEIKEGLRPHIGPPVLGELSRGLHESWSSFDAILSRAELELLDHIIRYGWSPLSLHSTPWYNNPRISPPKRLDSKVTRIRARKVYMIAKAIGFKQTKNPSEKTLN